MENQYKFLDVLFEKAVSEKSYVNLYAKLCKELDKELEQKLEINDKNQKTDKKPTSLMRKRLLEKCKAIFATDDKNFINKHIKVKDENDKEERDRKIKNYILGNVNFLGELIAVQILSRKIINQCIENLFDRYANLETSEEIRLINLDSIVILINKFGTNINSSGQYKLKEETLKKFNELIKKWLNNLDDIQKKYS